MAVAPEQSPTLLSRDDSAPPTPSDVTSEYDGLTAAEVLNKLEQAWCNELLAAELLDYKTYIVECVMEQVKEMEKNLSHIRSDSFVAGIHKLELERIKYVLCSYLRTRLNKIETNVIFLLEEEAGRGVDATSKLSPDELVYAKEYADHMENHMGTLVLRHMPSSFQKLDHNKAGTWLCMHDPLYCDPYTMSYWNTTD